MAKGIRETGRSVPDSAESRPSAGGVSQSVSYYMQSVMRGQQLADVPENWRDTVKSAMQYPIYQIACRVLELASRDDRREMIAKQPESIRGMVEAEVMRVWRIRQA